MTPSTSLSTATALYTPNDIEYQQAYSGPYKDVSTHGIVAGLKGGLIDGFGRPMVGFGSDKDLKQGIITLFMKCRNFWYEDFLIDGKLSVISKFLLSSGHKAVPYYTQVIDLTPPIEQIRAGIRKSYKSLCNKGDTVVSKNINKFREIHLLHHGNTRDIDTWSIQEKMMDSAPEQGSAFVCTDVDNGCMMYYNKDTAYYASGAGENCHAVVWHAIDALKGLGIKRLEMGEQVFGHSKEANISKFKRGFGGACEVRLRIGK
jgi:hypothetical protein